MKTVYVPVLVNNIANGGEYVVEPLVACANESEAWLIGRATLEEMLPHLESEHGLEEGELEVSGTTARYLVIDNEYLGQDIRLYVRPVKVPVAGPPSGGSVWDEDEDWPREDWRYDVANGDTSQGYWDWVAYQKETASVEDENADGPTL